MQTINFTVFILSRKYKDNIIDLDMKRFFKTIIFSFIVFALSAGIVSASEGTFELRSVDNNNYRCFAASLQMQNLNYQVTISCRNIIFPLDETIYTYVLLANPNDGGSPIKIGSIGLGRAQFSVKQEFSSLFITGEQNANVKSPSGNVVMKGSIKPITFLEQEQPTQTAEEAEQQTSTSSPTPTQTQTSLRDRLLTGLKRAGLATGLALVAIFGLVFVLTRPR